ncbi:MAG: PD-(D/E)XK nuclease family protein [bacterium]
MYSPPRVQNMFNPDSTQPFKLSRSKIENFIRCERCFYLDRRLGIDIPPTPSFTLNNAVDTLLKKEFDVHRAAGTSHPIMDAYGVDAVPLQHEKMDAWRDAIRRGIQFLYEPENLLITGGIDDVWVNPDGELIIVDYKATSKDGEVTLEGSGWEMSYKRQMEIYQWLFRQNNFKVSEVGYFVYCNGTTDRKAFDKKLEFNVSVLPYKGSDEWIPQALKKIKKCLMSKNIPDPNEMCDYCRYRKAAGKVE